MPVATLTLPRSHRRTKAAPTSTRGQRATPAPVFCPGPAPVTTLEAARTDAELMLACAERDERAFIELYERFGPRVFGLIYHILRDRAQAEDTFQDVMHEVWCKAGAYRSGLGSVTTWMLMIARSRSIDALRHMRLQRSLPHGLKPEFDSPPELHDPAAHRRLADALAGLSRDQQSVLVLAFFRGLSREQISNALGIPVGTVKTRIRRAIQSLR